MIYVASSWRNLYYNHTIHCLQNEGFTIYDFKNPEIGNNGFSWRSVDPDWNKANPIKYREMLSNPIAVRGFNLDLEGLNKSDSCLLILPSGRSAHLEAGYMIGQLKPTAIYIPEPIEPELMYKLASGGVLVSLDEVLNYFRQIYRR